jgi:uncharacterized membrane protein YphA (DoxX/SURF4 family)
MKPLNDMLNWFDSRRNQAYSLIRIYLGIALAVRGLIMLSDPSAITSLAGAQQMYMVYSYVFMGHLIGGILLAIGFMTRLAAFFQIPILAGAVFTIHLRQGLMTVGQSLELSSLVLFLLVIYFLFGPGLYAIDTHIGAKKSEVFSTAK